MQIINEKTKPTIEKQKGKGSSFTFRVPIKKFFNEKDAGDNLVEVQYVDASLSIRFPLFYRDDFNEKRAEFVHDFIRLVKVVGIDTLVDQQDYIEKFIVENWEYLVVEKARLKINHADEVIIRKEDSNRKNQLIDVVEVKRSALDVVEKNNVDKSELKEMLDYLLETEDFYASLYEMAKDYGFEESEEHKNFTGNEPNFDDLDGNGIMDYFDRMTGRATDLYDENGYDDDEDEDENF